MHSITAYAPYRNLEASSNLAWLSNGAIAFIMLISGIVVFEPAPYELTLLAVLAIWLLLGLRIPKGVVPLLLIMTLFNIGGLLAAFQVSDLSYSFQYVAVSYFLALSSVFFAIVISQDHKRIALIFKFYVISAIISTLLGLAGYFGVPGFGIFTLYNRSAGGFQDPNVYGPYLVTPLLYIIYLAINRKMVTSIVLAGVIVMFILGLLLAFSRAAWGLAAFTMPLFYLLLIINERNAAKRFRYIVLAVIGVVILLCAIAAVLQVDAVAKLFAERVKVVQDYDSGRLGRFARHALGFQLALEHPLGLGQLQFEKLFVEATHNNFLKALMDYGWLGFASWVTMIIVTLAGSFKLMFRPRPWQVYLQICWVVFFGHQLVGLVIDTDHWRHFYLLVGMIWGCMLLEQQWQKNLRSGNNSSFRPANTPPNASAARPPIRLSQA